MVPYDHNWSDEDDTVVTQTKDRESLIQTIERALAAHTGTHPCEFSPLYDYVETEALATLLNHATERGTEITVRFTVAEHRVVVSQDGSVIVHDVP